MAKPKVLVLGGYGINCEEETQFAFNSAGAVSEYVHINDLIDGRRSFDEFQILAIPGGFSYGDHTGAGKALANRIQNNLGEKILKFVQRDTLTIGICNGFQVLVALGLIPALDQKYGKRQAALLSNDFHRYLCRWVHLRVGSKKCVFTRGVEQMFVPVANGEGSFYLPEEKLDELTTNDQVVFVYIKPDGKMADQEFPHNPSGSARDIAGICDPTGRILGMMPHPERHLFFTNRPDFTFVRELLRREGKPIPGEGEGNVIFRNAVEYFR